jgi:hypothetical protein
MKIIVNEMAGSGMQEAQTYEGPIRKYADP